MELSRTDRLAGTTLVWLGVDPAGQVGVFSNAGWGPLPADVAGSADVVRAALPVLAGLPEIGAAVRTAKSERDDHYGSWSARAAAGLWVYQWEQWGGPYVRMAAPTVPTNVDHLPLDLQAVARFATFELSFDHLMALDLHHLA